MQSQELTLEQELPMTQSRCAVGVSWDQDAGHQHVDVDLQAVVVDSKGSIIDAVYYNNMKAQRCITHSGDETSGQKEGLDEVIWVGLEKMPANVQLIIFVVAVYSGGSLKDVRNGRIHLLGESKTDEVGHIGMQNSANNVDVVAVLKRGDASNAAIVAPWYFVNVRAPAEKGQHFMDIVEPTLGNLIRRYIPGAPRRMKVAFAMEKGSVMDLSAEHAMGSVTAGLGWDADKVRGKPVDLDVSAIVLSEGGKLTGTPIFFGNLRSLGLEHSGDNLTGAGEGDDEQIKCNLSQVPIEAMQIFFVVNIYTKGVSFSNVKNAYCRILDECGHELARYNLREGGSESGLIMARLFRDTDGRWGFQAIGQFSQGSMWKDCMSDVTNIFNKNPRQLQLRGQSTMLFSGESGGASDAHHAGHHSHHSAPLGAAAPGRPDAKKDCIVQ